MDRSSTYNHITTRFIAVKKGALCLIFAIAMVSACRAQYYERQDSMISAKLTRVYAELSKLKQVVKDSIQMARAATLNVEMRDLQLEKRNLEYFQIRASVGIPISLRQFDRLATAMTQKYIRRDPMSDSDYVSVIRLYNTMVWDGLFHLDSSYDEFGELASFNCLDDIIEKLHGLPSKGIGYYFPKYRVYLIGGTLDSNSKFRIIR